MDISYCNDTRVALDGPLGGSIDQKWSQLAFEGSVVDTGLGVIVKDAPVSATDDIYLGRGR